MAVAEANGNRPMPGGRIVGVDVFRGLALIAMAIYHFTWDLEFFGYAEAGTTLDGGWKLFARTIAASFMVLVGFGMFVSQANGFRKRQFLVRLAKVGAAAALISVATWFAMPNGFIFFGILHSIALSSIIALLFLNLTWQANVAIAVGVFVGATRLQSEFFDAPYWYWSGLSQNVPFSNDYVPIFPWFAFVLIGLAAARFMSDHDLFRVMAKWRPNNPFVSVLNFFSCHSLPTYLFHQPILLALVYGFVLITGGPDRSVAFTTACEQNCQKTRDGKFCKQFCGCVVGDLKSQQLWTGIQNRQIDMSVDPRVKSITRACSFPTGK